MVTKIIQIGDVHIRNYRRIDEYQEQLTKFIDICKNIVTQNGVNNTRIVICGDLLHNKTDISPEAYALASWFLRELNGICKTIVFSGNHDKIENDARLDPLSAMFAMCRFENVVFLDKESGYESCIFDDDNIRWCLYSAFDNFNKPTQFKRKNTKEKDKRYVGLFHGELKSSRTDVGHESETGLPPAYFEDIDFGLFGHIHKRQCISYNGIPLVYSGSLIQQDFGENVSGHGYVLWDVDKCTYDVFDIDNPNYTLYTFQVDNIDDVDNDKEEIINL